MLYTPILISILAGTIWQHPGGLVTDQTLDEVRRKIETQSWAGKVWESRNNALNKWAELPAEQLSAVFPKRRGNVYHNFSCPDCRVRLIFAPFTPSRFTCGACGNGFEPETDAGIYEPGDNYHGTMYDGWVCLFYQEAAAVAADLALAGRVEEKGLFLSRSRELLRLFAETIAPLPTDHACGGDSTRILTYHREGDNKILADLAKAYELTRGEMTEAERSMVESNAIRRILEDVMLEPAYAYDHNNIYQWYRTVLQAAVCLERDDLVDWCFGYGDFSPEALPEHRSLRRIVEKHFLPDGAYWELCSGYHLYPMYAFCELAVLSHNLSGMDPQRFPPEQYDCTHPDNFAGKTIKNALEWFVSMAMPDRTMPTVGDSMAPRAGLEDYVNTAEIGYRYFDLRAVGDCENLRNNRSWTGLLYGAPEIKQELTSFSSSCLSSGWVSLQSAWWGDRIWVGLNALKPGGGHQHADRLGLTLYSCGELLALEKATPYNESVTRVLGTETQSHTTVVVDRQSQKQGEALTGAETPVVTHFFNGKVLKSAELRGDHLYPQASVYRRTVAVVEDIVIDCFVVNGGATKDWLAFLAGGPPEISLAMSKASFEPGAWLYNGTNHVLQGDGASDWHALWKVGHVTSRLTMAGQPGTEVYLLETYPVANAVITEKHPPCPALCVRRTANSAFLAVWDAWISKPNLRSVTMVPGKKALLLQTRKNMYYIKFGDGAVSFPDGVTLDGDGAVTLLQNRDALAFTDGTYMYIDINDGRRIRRRLTAPGNLECDHSCSPVFNEIITCPIEYDTYGGKDHPRDASKIKLIREFLPTTISAPD